MASPDNAAPASGKLGLTASRCQHVSMLALVLALNGLKEDLVCDFR